MWQAVEARPRPPRPSALDTFELVPRLRLGTADFGGSAATAIEGRAVPFSRWGQLGILSGRRHNPNLQIALDFLVQMNSDGIKAEFPQRTLQANLVVGEHDLVRFQRRDDF